MKKIIKLFKSYAEKQSFKYNTSPLFLTSNKKCKNGQHEDNECRTLGEKNNSKIIQ